MNKYNSNEEIIFSVSIEDLQQEAIRFIGRKLTSEEIYRASKGIEAGLSFDIENVFKTAVRESVQ